MIYLDNSATTRPTDAVRAAVTFVSHAVARAEAMEIPTTDGLPFEEILNELW